MPFDKNKCYTIEQLESTHYAALRKIGNVLYNPKLYPDRTVKFCRSVLEFLNDLEYLTHKQYNAVMTIPDYNVAVNHQNRSRSTHSQKRNPYQSDVSRTLTKFFDNNLTKHFDEGTIPFDVDMFGDVYDVYD